MGGLSYVIKNDSVFFLILISLVLLEITKVM